MTPKISIRLVLYTDLGPAGWRLERERPLPVERFDFDDTEQGRAEAEKAREALQGYLERNFLKK
jgi:hypothetical protein